MNKGTPQIEDGYTRIANELLEALAGAKLNGSELKVVLAVIRLTYGYNVKTAKVTVRQLANMTDFPERSTERTLKSLADRKIIIRERSKTQVNKHYKEWKTRQNCPDKNDPSKMTGFTPTKMTGYPVQNDGISFPYNKDINKKNIKKDFSQNFEEKNQSREERIEELKREGYTIIDYGDENGGLPF